MIEIGCGSCTAPRTCTLQALFSLTSADLGQPLLPQRVATSCSGDCLLLSHAVKAKVNFVSEHNLTQDCTAQSAILEAYNMLA